MVETSRSRGTLVSASGFAERRAAHMIGSAAFFAPETCTSPSSGRPPVIFSLSTGLPLVRRQGPHGKRVDFLAHALAERAIDQLVALDAAFAGELRRDDHGLEVLAVADDFDVLAGESALDAALHAFGSDHVQVLNLYPDLSSKRHADATATKAIATSARLTPGVTSEAPKKP